VGIGSRELDFVGQWRISDVTSAVVTVQLRNLVKKSVLRKVRNLEKFLEKREIS
jgi:hypothetical protein